MNYEPNTRKWEVGDLVIHDADRKETAWLMQVEKVFKNGMIKTKYFNPQVVRCRVCGHKMLKYNKKRYKNDLKYLHNPKRFHIIKSYRIEGR